MKNKSNIAALTIVIILSSCAGNRKSISSYGGSFGENPVLAEKAIQTPAADSKTELTDIVTAETTAEVALPQQNQNNKLISNAKSSNSNTAVAEPFTVKEVTKKEQHSKKGIFQKKAKDGSGKSQIIALVLVLVLGGLGIHRFYLGYTGIGIIQLLTVGGFGIWALIDLIRIITGGLKPKDGEYDETF